MKKAMVFVAFLVGALLLAVNSASAQGPPGGGRGGMGMGMGLWQNEAIQKELELVPEQIEKLEALQNKMRESMQQTFEGMRDLTPEQRQAKFEEMRDTMEKQREQLEKDMNSILLPHQVERLQQIQRQMQMRFRGNAILSDGELAEQLGITEEQKKKLAEVQQQAQKELQEKIQKAQEEAREKLLEVLTPEQKAKLKKLIGEPFEMPAMGPTPGGPQQGDRPTIRQRGTGQRGGRPSNN